MERTCNSCQCHNACPECFSMSEEQKNELSCQKYQPMPLEEYIMHRKEKYSNYMIDTGGVERYFK